MVQDKDKYLFGICKVGEKGQIVIPKQARQAFDINTGDKGLALVKAEVFSAITDEIMGGEKK